MHGGGSHAIDNSKARRRACRWRVLSVLATLAVVGLPELASAQYVESFESWSATSADTWQTKDLSGAPFSVPGSVVVEVAIRNVSTSESRFGGVRAVGSSLERRIDLHEAAGGGTDVLVMHVQTDASSQIQHYADNTADVDFVLLGYWECGTYVELFGTFSAASSWTDEDLNAYGLGPGDIAEIVMTNEADSQAYYAGTRTNGSSLDRRVVLQSIDDGVDTITMFVQADNSGSATIEAYAGHVIKVDFYVVGYWSPAPGVYTETFTDIDSPSADATWEDEDLTASGASDGSVVEILFANNITTQENELGIRANGSSVARLFDLREENDGSGGGDFGRMHALSDASAVIELRHEDVSDAHSFRMIGHWSIGAILDDQVTGQETDAFTEQSGETDAELFAFVLTPCSGTLTITEIVFRLTDIAGLTDPDWADVELVVDDNYNGDIGTGETTTVGGAGSVNTAAGTITFSTSFDITTGTSYILRADFASLSLGDQVTIGLDKNDITGSGPVTGSATSVTHLKGCYTATFEAWTASSADTWQTQDLSGPPYNVRANAVVEVAIMNGNTSNPRWGGVRAVGSSLDRRVQLQEAEGGGEDVLVMHVQANASSQIQHYSDLTTDVDFVLLGIWTCGTYVELFDTFTAGASTSWQDRDLCSYGVGPEHVAEIIMTNGDIGNEWEAGVRTNGSSLERRLDLHEAENGGVDTATMFVKTDATAGATIELYAQSDTNVDFYLAGYWSVAPLAYSELFADIGSPSIDATWEDIDLTSSGVTNTAVVELVLANEALVVNVSMGARANGSSLGRLLDIHEAQGGGSDLGHMHVQSDATATIEFYHQDVSDAHTFHLIGYWTNCDSSISYSIADLGAVTPAESSLGYSINASGDVAGYDEDAGGDSGAWLSECGSFTSLGTFAGGSVAEALGINSSGEVVGWSDNAAGNRKAFFYDGSLTDLDTLTDRTDSEATAVNASSEVAGTAYNSGTPPTDRLAFIYLPAPAYTLGAGINSLGTLGGYHSVAMDINDSGQVVGGSENASEYMRPFRWQNGSMTDLGTLGGEIGSVTHRANAINSSGNIVGTSYTASGDAHAFLWDGGMTDLGVLTGGDTSWALGINDSDEVVGTSNVTGGAFHAFIWDSTNGIRNLNDLVDAGEGWTLTRATGINDDGSITGWGTNSSSDVRAFLLTPSCSAGGGAAAAAAMILLATGAGTTDTDGVLNELVVSDEGAPLAQIVVADAEPDKHFALTVTAPGPESTGAPGPGLGTLAGFNDGVALDHTLTVESPALQGSLSLTVSMTFQEYELDDWSISPADVELHVLDTTQSPSPGTWIPAGVNIGQSEPTGIVGESGFVVYTDDSVDFWAVRDEPGVFAVGAKSSTQDDADDSNVTPASPTFSPVCGLGMIPCALAAMVTLISARTRRRRSRSH